MAFQVFVDLKHRGLMDNTVVVVTTDNGGGPWDSNTPLRGTKVLGDAFDDHDDHNSYNNNRKGITKSRMWAEKKSCDRKICRNWVNRSC